MAASFAMGVVNGVRAPRCAVEFLPRQECVP